MGTKGLDALALRPVPLEENGTERFEQCRLADFVGFADEVQPVLEAGEVDGLAELAEVFDLEITDTHQAVPLFWLR